MLLDAYLGEETVDPRLSEGHQWESGPAGIWTRFADSTYCTPIHLSLSFFFFFRHQGLSFSDCQPIAIKDILPLFAMLRSPFLTTPTNVSRNFWLPWIRLRFSMNPPWLIRLATVYPQCPWSNHFLMFSFPDTLTAERQLVGGTWKYSSKVKLRALAERIIDITKALWGNWYLLRRCNLSVKMM